MTSQLNQNPEQLARDSSALPARLGAGKWWIASKLTSTGFVPALPGRLDHDA